MNRPRSFCPCRSAWKSPAATAAAGSSVACGSHVPVSHTITSPPPYCPDGITPSKSRYSMRVVLDVDGRVPDVRIEGRALGHGPAHQHAVDLEPEVVVQPSRPVPLHDEPRRMTGSAGGRLRRAAGSPATRPARRLRGLREVPLLLIRREPVRGRLARGCSGRLPGRRSLRRAGLRPGGRLPLAGRLLVAGRLRAAGRLPAAGRLRSLAAFCPLAALLLPEGFFAAGLPAAAVSSRPRACPGPRPASRRRSSGTPP